MGRPSGRPFFIRAAPLQNCKKKETDGGRARRLIPRAWLPSSLYPPDRSSLRQIWR
jgi:hypothetical protein